MRSLLVAVLVATTGCAGVVDEMTGSRPSRGASLAELTHEPDGVCVFVDDVRSCFTTNRAGAPPDCFVLTTITSVEPVEANPVNWRVVVTRSDGTTVLDRTLAVWGIETQSICLYGVCRTTGRSLDRVEPWRPGMYTIRYTYLRDPARRAEMTIWLR